MKTPLLYCGAISLVLLILATVTISDLIAYERYNDGCQDCHGAFTDDFSTKPNNTWPDDKHNVHRREMLDNVCDACHLDGDNRNPYLNQSNGTNDLVGIGCLGCHGRYYEDRAEYLGAGLRSHHWEAGVDFCGFCHSDPLLLPETVKPEYYGKPTVNIKGTCNLYGSENWTPDGLGLDNDGDDNYDMDDLDCFGPPKDLTPVHKLF
jgi:hypothetical protein